jgi:hypothetical protein
MKLYRLLTGPDDAAFCRRVSETLNKGWHLHGPPSVTFDAQKGTVICGQAIVKEIGGVEWSDEIKLSEW